MEAPADRQVADTSFDSRRLFTGAEPGLSDLRAQEVIRIELGARLNKGRRGDDGPRLRRLRIFLVIIDLVGIANRPGEHHDVSCFDGESLYCHMSSSLYTIVG